jgi:hypothetical protein
VSEDKPAITKQQLDEDHITCTDSCGRKVLIDAVEQSGWSFLPITRRWRCPQCWRDLQAVNVKEFP